MNLKISEKLENSLLGREDITGSIAFEGATPSNTDVAAEIAKQIKANEDLVVVKQIKTEFSFQSATFNAVAYKDAGSKAKFEVMTKHLKKIAEKKAKEAAERKAAEAAAKKKAEEEAKAAKEAEAATE